MTVIVLDRPRHAELIKQCRAAGARIRLISDGDVGGAIEVAKAGASVDILLGIGGTPEGVIAGRWAWLTGREAMRQRVWRTGSHGHVRPWGGVIKEATSGAATA